MKLIRPYYVIESTIPDNLLQMIERIGRVSYKSEEKISEDSAKKFVKMLIDKKHYSVLEHYFTLTVRFIVDRGISHELVRQRLASFTQESTRYCNYSGGKFGNELSFIKPSWFTESDIINYDNKHKIGDTEKDIWIQAMQDAEDHYLDLVAGGWSAQKARSVLPNSLKTEIVVSANLREWRHILELRTDKAAHPQMREIMIPLLRELQEKIPVIFDDILPIAEKSINDITDNNIFTDKLVGDSFGLFEGFAAFQSSTNVKEEPKYDVMKATTPLMSNKLNAKNEDGHMTKLQDNLVTAIEKTEDRLFNDIVDFRDSETLSDKSTEWKISKVLEGLESLLKYKNRKYGDAALNPDNIFSKLDNVGSIKVRLDDKIARIRNGKELQKNDLTDLMGYLTLLAVSYNWISFKEFED